MPQEGKVAKTQDSITQKRAKRSPFSHLKPNGFNNNVLGVIIELSKMTDKIAAKDMQNDNTYFRIAMVLFLCAY